MITIKNIHKSYGRNQVLKGLNVIIQKGAITAVLGPNASGKTTLIKCILGLVIPETGKIEINGREISHDWNYRRDIGYLPQIARFPENLKVKELVRMITDIRGNHSNETSLVDLFDLSGVMNKHQRQLSGGTRQKVNIMLALMFDSPILILDEPTIGLDPLSLIRFKNLLQKERSKGKTILLTTHIVSLVEELADNIVFLLEGKIFFNGSLSELNEVQGEVNLENAIANIFKEHHA